MEATNSKIELVKREPSSPPRPMLWEMNTEERERRLAELRKELTDDAGYDS